MPSRSLIVSWVMFGSLAGYVMSMIMLSLYTRHARKLRIEVECQAVVKAQPVVQRSYAVGDLVSHGFRCSCDRLICDWASEEEAQRLGVQGPRPTGCGWNEVSVPPQCRCEKLECSSYVRTNCSNP